MLLRHKLKQLALARRDRASSQRAAALARIRSRVNHHAAHTLPLHSPQSHHYESWAQVQQEAMPPTSVPSPQTRLGHNWLSASFHGMVTTAAPTLPPTPQASRAPSFSQFWHHDTNAPTPAPVPTPSAWLQQEALPSQQLAAVAPNEAQRFKNAVQRARFYAKSSKGGTKANVVENPFHF